MEKMKLYLQKNKKYLSIALGIIIIIYFAVSFYFTSHFYFGTTINGVNVSGATLEEASNLLNEEGNKYSIELKGRNNLNYKIAGEEIEFKYDAKDNINDIKEKQSAFGWIAGIFSNNNYEVENLITYNKEKLDEKIITSSFFEEGNNVSPINATYELKENTYSIIKEVEGSKVKDDVLKEKVNEAVRKGQHTFVLDDSKCYEEPSIRSDSTKLVKAVDEMNKYIKANITYNVLDKQYNIKGEEISNWITVNENCDVILNEDAIYELMNEIASNYSSIGKTRDFNTSLGTVAQVSGGDYGIAIDTTAEVQALIQSIKDGKTEEKEPEFAQAAMANSNVIGDTYVEINLTTQYLWAYSNGKVVAEGSVVTGNSDGKHDTPQGVYKLKYKQRNAILRGPGYETPVTFWMPFNGDIGMHDATWRGSFGGNIYTYDGSHGCVNCSYDLAQGIFDNIPAGAPIICYY